MDGGRGGGVCVVNRLKEANSLDISQRMGITLLNCSCITILI